jgi:hypothetical protein
MINIAKQLGITVAFVAVLYGALILGAMALVPMPDGSSGLDSPGAADTVFMTQPKYVFLNRGALARDDGRSQVILIGSSNVARGFSRDDVQALVPDAIVHNLAVSGSNNTEIDQVVELIQEMQSEEARRRSVYVLGIWYGMFAEDRTRWYAADRTGGDTDIDIERYRYAFYRRTADGPVAVLPPRYLDLGVAAVYPFLVIDGLVRGARDNVRDRLYTTFGFSFLRRPRLGDEQEDGHVVDAREQATWLAYRKAYMQTPGTVADEQFAVLDRMVRRIVDGGSRVVVVDLPIPRWHSANAPYFTDYQQRKTATIAALNTLKGVSYLNLQDADADHDYYDDAHPKRAAAKVWSQRLARVLNPIVVGAPDVAAALHTGGQEE